MTVRKERDGNRSRSRVGGFKCGWKRFLLKRSPLMVEEILGTVATVRRRTCGQDRNVEGVKQTFRARQAQAGCINRERHRPESARTKCWHSRPSGIKRQKCAYEGDDGSLSLQICRGMWWTSTKTSDDRNCKISGKDEMISCQSIKRCRHGRRSCRVCRTRSSSAKRMWASRLKNMDNWGLSSKTRVQKMEENDHKIEAES